MKTTGFVSSVFATGNRLVNAAEPQPGNTCETQAVGIPIIPGARRPHDPWEYLARVSPPWPSRDYIWLGFPEAIVSSQRLLYLRHIQRPIHPVFSALTPVPWTETPGGIAFERTVPHGVSFERARNTVRRHMVESRNVLMEPDGRPVVCQEQR